MRTDAPGNILVVVGSRPEAIKLAPVVFALRAEPWFETIVCSTGQQRDLIPQALGEFGIEPHLELDVMRPSQSLAMLTSRLMAAFDEVFRQIEARWVIVQGDTTSAMAGALAAFYHGIDVAHVEAGMRTDDPRSPFPEEVNRRVITQCATMHFAPTAGCRRNLLRDGVAGSRIAVTGNTVIDALYWMRDRARTQGSRLAPLLGDLEGRRLLFVTAHRRESFDGGIDRICTALRSLVAMADDIVVVMAVHPNPAVGDIVRERLSGQPRIRLIEPQSYAATVELMDRATLVLTDSGGLQEEAPALGTPVLVLRDTTERPEGVEAGAAVLVGTDPDAIVSRTLELLTDPARYARMAATVSPYGDGSAARRIAEILVDGATGVERRVAGRHAGLETPLAGGHR